MGWSKITTDSSYTLQGDQKRRALNFVAYRQQLLTDCHWHSQQ